MDNAPNDPNGIRALADIVESLAGDNARNAENIRALTATVDKLTATVDKVVGAVVQDAENIRALARIAEAHQPPPG